MKEARPEDYLVRALIDFDDICYLLIPHDALAGNMTLDGLASRYTVA